jgi:hypothetical protein
VVWVVNGQQGRVLCFAASLSRAIERSEEFAASGAVVVAICRLPSDDIIVFPAQIDRLRRLAASPMAMSDREPREDRREGAARKFLAVVE